VAALLVVSSWLHHASEGSENRAFELLADLKARVPRLLYLEQASPFRLCQTPVVLAVADAVLKVNGVYADPALNAFDVGAPRADGNWSRPDLRLPNPPSPELVERVHLSVPCFLGCVPTLRSRVQRLYGRNIARRVAARAGEALLSAAGGLLGRPPYAVHFLGALTHIQRLDAVRRLRESGVPWLGGLTDVPREVTGAAPEELEGLRSLIAAEGFAAPRAHRLAYRRDLLRCKAVLSITGYGELAFRMAEAWASRRLLICQDLSHARTLFPLEAGRNVVYCRPDLTDLADLVRDVHENWERWRLGGTGER